MRYVCSNAWQTVATHHVDLPGPWHLYAYREGFDPKAVALGDRVFVRTDLLDAFVRRALPAVARPFVLVTGDSDACPSEAAIDAIHGCERVVRWHAVNAPVATHKLAALPLGLREPALGDHDAIAAQRGSLAPRPQRPIDALALPDWNVVPGALRRHPRLTAHDKHRPYPDRLALLASARFALCPCTPDGGADVHAVYECLLLHTVPIYVQGDLPVPAAYARLPVIVATDMPHLARVLDDLDDWERWAQAIDWQAVHDTLSTTAAWI